MGAGAKALGGYGDWKNSQDYKGVKGSKHGTPD